MPTIDVPVQTPVNQYTANPSQTVFAYTFLLFSDADVQVIVDGVTKTLTTDYTVSGVLNEAGGNITFGTGLTGGESVTLKRKTSIGRDSQYQADGTLDAAPLERDLDKITTILQELRRDADASVKLNVADLTSSSELPLPEANKSLMWSGSSPYSLVNGPTAADIANAAPNAAIATTKAAEALASASAAAASAAAASAAAAGVVGKHTICIPALAMTPRRTNGSAILAYSNGATDQPDIPYLAFDGASDEYASFTIPMPKGWNEGTVTAKFYWRRASGTGAANVIWGIRGLAVSNSDSPVANFSAAATVVAAADTTTTDLAVSSETSACTIGGTPAEGDLVFFEVLRNGANALDTLDAVDAHLVAVQLFYTTDAATDA